MARKLFAEHAYEMWGRGWRELGGFWFPDGNIPQPTHLRGGYAAKDIEPAKQPSVLEETLARAHESRDDPGRDDRGRDDPGLDRD